MCCVHSLQADIVVNNVSAHAMSVVEFLRSSAAANRFTEAKLADVSFAWVACCENACILILWRTRLWPSFVNAGVGQDRCSKAEGDGRATLSWVSLLSCRVLSAIVLSPDVLCFVCSAEPKKADELVCAKQLVATMVARGLLEEKVVANEVRTLLCLVVVPDGV
jgi:hypothetical protein